MSIYKFLKEKISFKKRTEKKLEPDFYTIELSNRNILIDDYEEIQAFVYRDLDLIKKKSFYTSYVKSLPQPLSEEAKNKIYQNKMELSRTLDKMIRDNQSIKKEIERTTNPARKKIAEQSPIPRHPSTPDSE